MLKNLFDIPKPKYDIYTGRKISRRKPFKVSTKKKVWMLAGGHNPDNWRAKFIKTSDCMNKRCKRKLIWGDRSYEFDHKDNNSTNNSQKNCYLLCAICHKKYTILVKRKIKDSYGFGKTIGYQTIKKKVGYKKLKKKTTKKRCKRNPRNLFEFPRF